VQQTATCTAATLIGTADECQHVASAQLNLQFAAVAGSDWETGCLFHNGAVYFSPFQAGSTNKPITLHLLWTPIQQPSIIARLHL
jgi:hypothetical protein